MPDSNIKNNKDLVIMIMALGDAYLEKGLYAEALKRYNQLLAHKIANKRIYTNLSKTLMGMKRFDSQAMAVYQKAIEYDPANVEIYHVLAKSFLQEKRDDDDAVRIYDIALKTKSPDFEQIADFLSTLFYTRNDYRNCKVMTERLLKKTGYQEKTVTYFLDCAWKTHSYHEAVNTLKELIDKEKENEVLLKYLCLTYLEKSHHSFLREEPVTFSFIDRELAKSYLHKLPKIERLQDLTFYLELQRFLSDSEYWGNLEILAQHEENALVMQQAQQNAVEAEHQTVNSYTFSRNRQIMERLRSLNRISEQDFTARGSLTFEDFQNDQQGIFSELGEDSSTFKIPEDADIIVTIELSNYDKLKSAIESDRLAQLRSKFIFILTKLLEKYQIAHMLATENGFLIFDKNIINSVTLSVDLLNKINRFNFMDDVEKKVHVSIGIHHTRNGLDTTSDDFLKELSTGVKLGVVNETDLPEEDRPMYAKVFQKTDRIFLSSKAYREIKSSKRYRVGPIGQFKLKYLKEKLSIHEVSWRNPIDDLKFGYIRNLGRFNLLAEIGDKGGIKVFKAKDPDLQRFVILKVIQSEMFNALPENNPHKIEFYRIARSLAQMNHPHVANIYDVDEDQGLTFIVRQFIEGQTITERFLREPVFKPELFIKIIYQIFKGLQYAHRLGHSHLNLKPTNIRVGENNETKIMDFLIPGSALADYSGRTDENHKMYWSPEQVQGQKGDSRSDIFSLGVVMYETVTGKHPFVDSNYRSIDAAILQKSPAMPSEINPKVPKFCDALILKSMAKNPENRVQSAEQIVTLLKKNFEKILFSKFTYQIAQSRNSF